MSKFSVRKCCNLLFIALWVMRVQAQGQTVEQSDATLMRLVAEKRAESLDLLRTWKGMRKRTVREMTADGDLAPAWQETTAFAFDAGGKRRRWRSESMSFPPSDGAPGIASIDGSLRLGGLRYRLSAESDRPKRVCYVSPDDGARDALGTGFEIIDQFDPGRDDLFKVYEAYSAYMQNENTGASLTRDGSLVIRSMKGPAGFLNQWTYDLNKGGHLVSYLARNPEKSREETYKTEYVLQNGAWIPEKITHTRLQEGKVFLREESVFSTEALNEPLHAADFSLETLGVRISDWILDKRTGIEYAYEGSLPDDVLSPRLELVTGVELPLEPPEWESPPTEPAAETAIGADDAAVQEDSQPLEDSPTSGEESKTPAFFIILIAAVFVVLGALVIARKRRAD